MKIRADAGLEDFTAHDIRHSWAAFALAGGLNLSDVGHQLNHKTYETTKRYAHLAENVKLKNVAIVGSMITSVANEEKKVAGIRERIMMS